MSSNIHNEYLSIGGNRHTAASAWSQRSGRLAFGADQNVAIWLPLGDDKAGVRHLLQGHVEKVTAVTFTSFESTDSTEWLISGSADGRIIIWEFDTGCWQVVVNVEAHNGAVNAISTHNDSKILVSGGANAELKIWKMTGDGMELTATHIPKPRIIPLTLTLGRFSAVSANDGLFLAVGGTRSEVQIYALKGLSASVAIELQANLKGHEGWIHSLALKSCDDGRLLLASASADKYVRLWQFLDNGDASTTASNNKKHITEQHDTLTAKTQTVSVPGAQYTITFEALLLGHEDWVYSAAWNPGQNSNQLLTASADGTLAIWEADESSGIWISASKLGEISGQKGATTATGSSGGFWTGLWSPDGQTVTSLGRTGSWRLWTFDKDASFWVQKAGVGGHIGQVNGISWSPFGEYLLSTSADQTTRLHAEWRRDTKRTWHELARPQIHGYDLNCISTTDSYQFVSGANEKLLRVFNEPKDIAAMLHSLCQIDVPVSSDLPDLAAIPVLGLSNKAIGVEDDSFTEVNGKRDQEYVAPSVLETSLAKFEEPPNEDILARHTLWPEHEKLYGHGYEISECAASGHILATACKASSTDHAVIRLYSTKTWTEIKPSLTAHSLTVTRLAWSYSPDCYLLSVGRDRQWAIFACSKNNFNFELIQSNPKAHTRMILDAAWSPIGGMPFFATAGRDKTVKIWHCEWKGEDEEHHTFAEWLTIKRDTSVTAIDFTCNVDESYAILAVGEESGRLSLHFIDIEHHLSLVKTVEISPDLCASKTVNRLTWRPDSRKYLRDGGGAHLAVASADGSVRIMSINVESLCKSLRS